MQIVRHAHTSRIVGAGPAGLLLSHCCTARASIGGARNAHARRRSKARSAPACSSRARSTCSNAVGLGEPARTRGIRASRHRAALRRPRPRHRPATRTGGRAITVYAQHEVIRDLVAARLADGGGICSGVRTSAARIRRRARLRSTTREGEAARARLRLHRRLRRLPRRLAAPSIPARRAQRVHAQLSVRLVRHPRRRPHRRPRN